MAQINRILFILDMFGFFGGPERRAYRIARGLKKRGYDISIVSIMKADDEMIKRAEDNGIKAYQVTYEHNKALRSYRMDVFLKLRKLIRKIDPEVIFTFEFLADYTTKMALLGLDLPIFTFIGSTVWKWERKWHRRIVMEHFVKRSKLYIANSETVKENVIRVLPSTKNKIAILYNPIDTSHFKPLTKENKVETRRKYGLDEKDFVVGSVVRFYNPKGADVLINAFKLSGVSGKLALVGDGSLKQELINLTGKLGIDDRVMFLGALEATPEIYNMFDICVVPSQKGGFDNVVIEAMACGIPTVATRATGIGEVAENGRDLVITEIDAESIAEGIRNINESLYKFSMNGRKFVLDILSLDKVSKKIEELMYV